MSRPSVFLFASKHNSNSCVRFLFPFSIMTGSGHTTGLCKVGELVKYKERAFMKFQPLHGHGFLIASFLHTCGKNKKAASSLILPGAIVIDGNKSNTVFLIIWKPKAFSSVELIGRGSKPSTSSIFTRWSATVEWIWSMTWMREKNETSYSTSSSSWHVIQLTHLTEVDIPLVKNVQSEFVDLHRLLQAKG